MPICNLSKSDGSKPVDIIQSPEEAPTAAATDTGNCSHDKKSDPRPVGNMPTDTFYKS